MPKKSVVEMPCKKKEKEHVLAYIKEMVHDPYFIGTMNRILDTSGLPLGPKDLLKKLETNGYHKAVSIDSPIIKATNQALRAYVFDTAIKGETVEEDTEEISAEYESDQSELEKKSEESSEESSIDLD